jgi:hypothetical protein
MRPSQDGFPNWHADLEIAEGAVMATLEVVPKKKPESAAASTAVEELVELAWALVVLAHEIGDSRLVSGRPPSAVSRHRVL